MCPQIRLGKGENRTLCDCIKGQERGKGGPYVTVCKAKKGREGPYVTVYKARKGERGTLCDRIKGQERGRGDGEGR